MRQFMIDTRLVNMLISYSKMTNYMGKLSHIV
jgi:hypothetical protein